MLDVRHALSKLVEDRPCAFDEKTPAFRQLDAARGSIQEWRTQSMLHVRDCFGNRRLRQREVR
jgi:hypothetical protein